MCHDVTRLEHSEDGPLLHLGVSNDSEEALVPDDFDEELDNALHRPDCPSPDSSIGDMDGNIGGM